MPKKRVKFVLFVEYNELEIYIYIYINELRREEKDLRKNPSTFTSKTI